MAKATQLKQALEAGRAKAKQTPGHELLKLTDIRRDLF
jgi:hypothetical protein